MRLLLVAKSASAALLRAPAAAPASRREAHAPLSRRCDHPLALCVTLAQRALGASRLVGGTGPCSPRLLGGDGAEQVVALAEEVSAGRAQCEAALAEDHAGAGGLGGM